LSELKEREEVFSSLLNSLFSPPLFSTSTIKEDKVCDIEVLKRVEREVFLSSSSLSSSLLFIVEFWRIKKREE